MKRLILLTSLLASTPVFAQTFECHLVSDLPHETKDPVWKTEVIVGNETTPPSMWVIHYANSGAYNRGNQYIPGPFTWSETKIAWTGINKKNPRLRMFGTFELGESGWIYTEILSHGLKLDYISLSACNQVTPSVHLR